MYSRYPPWMYGVFIFVALLTFSWIPVQAFTPWNDWCAGDNKIMVNVYQPANVVWCILDVATSLGIVTMFGLLYRRLISSMENMTHLKNQSGDGTRDKDADTRLAAIQTKALARHVTFALQQAIVSIISMTLAGLIFDAQYNYGMTSDLVCIFCVLLYTAYAVRRVPMSWHFSGYRSRNDLPSRADASPPVSVVSREKGSKINVVQVGVPPQDPPNAEQPEDAAL